MKVFIKQAFVANYLKEKNLTKNKFCKICDISVKTFDKFMRGEQVALVVALKICVRLKIEYSTLF